MPAFPDRPQTATEILQAQIDWIDNQRGKYLREELENCVSRAKGLQKELNSLEVQRKGLLKALARLQARDGDFLEADLGGGAKVITTVRRDQ